MKENAIVKASLAENRRKDGNGTGRGEPVPKRRAKVRSLINPSPIFAVLVATNFGVPEV